VAPEGGHDLGAALRYRRRPGRVHGDDVREKLLDTFKALAPEVVGAPQLLELFIFEGLAYDLLRGVAYLRLVLHGTQREEQRALGEGLDDYDGPAGPTTRAASRRARCIAGCGTWWRELRKMAPSKEASAKGNASARAAWKDPSETASRAVSSASGFGSIPAARSPFRQ
jgi:hypothetical protein